MKPLLSCHVTPFNTSSRVLLLSKCPVGDVMNVDFKTPQFFVKWISLYYSLLWLSHPPLREMEYAWLSSGQEGIDLVWLCWSLVADTLQVNRQTFKVFLPALWFTDCVTPSTHYNSSVPHINVNLNFAEFVIIGRWLCMCQVRDVIWKGHSKRFPKISD